MVAIIKRSSHDSNESAVGSAILLSAQSAGARVVLDSENGHHALIDVLQAESIHNGPEPITISWQNRIADALKYNGNTQSGHPWEVVLV